MITSKDIIFDTDPRIRMRCEPVAIPLSKEDKQTVLDLHEYIINSQNPEFIEKDGGRSGVGLAAPQIGITKRMIAIHLQDIDGKLYSYKLINPKIISHSVEQTFIPEGEGCLSVNYEVEGIVPRAKRIRVKAFDENGEPIELKLQGYPAIVIQHEVDHLNGILFYDHINKENPFHIPKGAKPLQKNSSI
ncbi:MAG TPA: peptide deformylase [Firmicutes bacterium]|nr:peptide deformylase [Bacillales bacterium]HJA40518.1 peptide deformylase [Bacillota bacterium]